MVMVMIGIAIAWRHSSPKVVIPNNVAVPCISQMCRRASQSTPNQVVMHCCRGIGGAIEGCKACWQGRVSSPAHSICPCPIAASNCTGGALSALLLQGVSITYKQLQCCPACTAGSLLLQAISLLLGDQHHQLHYVACCSSQTMPAPLQGIMTTERANYSTY